jgi:hypothetical protein
MTAAARGPKVSTSALCCECGAVRTVSAHCLLDREFKCAACKTTRMHAVLGYGLIEDWRENINQART